MLIKNDIINNSINKSYKRLGYVDIFRGIGIILYDYGAYWIRVWF